MTPASVVSVMVAAAGGSSLLGVCGKWLGAWCTWKAVTVVDSGVEDVKLVMRSTALEATEVISTAGSTAAITVVAMGDLVNYLLMGMKILCSIAAALKTFEMCWQCAVTCGKASPVLQAYLQDVERSLRESPAVQLLGTVRRA